MNDQKTSLDEADNMVRGIRVEFDGDQYYWAGEVGNWRSEMVDMGSVIQEQLCITNRTTNKCKHSRREYCKIRWKYDLLSMKAGEMDLVYENCKSSPFYILCVKM